MRRAVTEWGLVVSGVLSIALGAVWLESLWLEALQEPLWLAPDCFLRVNTGELCFFSELGDDWKPKTEGRDHPTVSSVLKYSNWMLPGLEYHNRRLANGRTIWSLEVAIVVPLAVLVIMMLVLWRVRRGHWGIGRSAAR